MKLKNLIWILKIKYAQIPWKVHPSSFQPVCLYCFWRFHFHTQPLLFFPLKCLLHFVRLFCRFFKGFLRKVFSKTPLIWLSRGSANSAKSTNCGTPSLLLRLSVTIVCAKILPYWFTCWKIIFRWPVVSFFIFLMCAPINDLSMVDVLHFLMIARASLQ